MKTFILLTVVALAYAKSVEQAQQTSAFGFIRNVAIPLGDEIRKAEEAYSAQVAQGRIAGGSPSQLGQFPYQGGVLTNFIGMTGVGICGASLVSSNRLIYAAHCWYDGENQGYAAEIVLGSVLLFSGGTRIAASNIAMHPQWNPRTTANDVAVVYLQTAVTFSDNIAPIALPSGSQLNENFAGEVATASGFGRTGDGAGDGLTTSQFLSHVSLNVIQNSVCRTFFPANVIDSNICTSGVGGTSTCRGDSGGPLAVIRNNQPVLVGITSFGSIWGCTLGFPAAFARVTSFISFFNQHL